MIKSIQELLHQTDRCNSLICAFLQHKLVTNGKLEQDYPVSELTSFYNAQYNTASYKNKDWVAIWNYQRLLQEKEVEI